VSTPEAAKAHLRPLLAHRADPGAFADLERAALRLAEALDRSETILVHGDYDVDGISATALLTRVLRGLGGHVVPFVPHRLRDGYDFGPAGLARAREVDAELVLTVDCGIVAHDAVAAATAGGLDVIVTDHHTPGDRLPDAFAVVNPNRRDCAGPEKGLCGAGVAFKLLERLVALRGGDPDALLPHLDLVALATVADLVPLTGENRVLVRYGLRALTATEKPGLRALLETAEVQGDVGAGQVGFRIAPRINAVGRLGDAADALELLLTDDPERARTLARHAEETNRRRQDEDRRTLDQALELVDDLDPRESFGVVLAREGWHPGVIGIVASRVVERIHRPVVLVALDGNRGRGSGRSIPGFHLYEALHACRHRLARFGGHRQAAGMELSGDQVEAFAADFNAQARRHLEGRELRAELRADAELGLPEADLPLARLFGYLGPHGMGNPRPVFLARDLQVVGRPREVGTGHLKLHLRQDGTTHPAIGFGLAERIRPDTLEGRRVDALFQLTVNEWRGRQEAQLQLKDVRPAGADGP
jgi:single-stranded-DNA-specific exonuclease